MLREYKRKLNADTFEKKKGANKKKWKKEKWEWRKKCKICFKETIEWENFLELFSKEVPQDDPSLLPRQKVSEMSERSMAINSKYLI